MASFLAASAFAGYCFGWAIAFSASERGSASTIVMGVLFIMLFTVYSLTAASPPSTLMVLSESLIESINPLRLEDGFRCVSRTGDPVELPDSASGKLPPVVR